MTGSALIKGWAVQRDEALKNPALGLKLTKKANSAGEYFLAVEIAETFLNRPNLALDPKMRLVFQQQLALALARSGFTQRAKGVLEQLRAGGATDGETLGLFGSIYKALAGKAPEPADKTALLQTSRDYYRQGFEQARDTYCGINAAALDVLLDDAEGARKVAEATKAAVPVNDDYWDLATRAEADLIGGQLDQARAGYKAACAAAGDRWADIASTRKQCRMLCAKLQQNRALLDDCFPSGTVGFFAGHMVDAPDRETPRFPASAEASVTERINAWVRANSVRFTYSSAAAGGDIIFLEAAQAYGAETHIMLPFAPEYFLKTSVADRGENWTKRFEAVLDKAASVTVLNEDTPEYHSSSYDFTNRMLSARAAAKAAASDLTIRALALWDGQMGDGSGGTADAVAYWSRGRVPIQKINPTNPALDGDYDSSQVTLEKPFPRIYTASPKDIQTAVATLLYLRLQGYKSLREKDFKEFAQNVLGPLAEMLVQKKWYPARLGFGGHYLFVWDKVLDAGIAALEFMASLQEGAKSLSVPLRFNVCLDTGPLQMMVNPILNQYTYEGASIAKVRLLTEQLQPDIIYATQPFADLATFERIRDFNCEYSGTVGVSETSDGTPVYQVTR